MALLRFRLFAAFFAASLTAGTFAACSASNGAAIPSTVYDASPLDAGGNMEPPDEGDGDTPPKEAGAEDAPSDAADAKSDATAAGDVRISEVYVDNALVGDGAEYVELRGTAGTKVDDLRLRLVDHTGNVKYDVPVGNPGDTIPQTGFWVVGGNQVFKVVAQDHVDHVVSVNSWGMDNDSGAVQLVRGTTLLDVVGYSRDADAGTIPPVTTAPSSSYETRPALVPDVQKKAFGRKSNAADTNDNHADFCKMTPSPGKDQVACDL